MSQQRYVKSVLWMSFLALSLQGCSSAKRSLGMERSSAEPYGVGDFDALVVPPEFNLRPPLSDADKAKLEEDKGGNTKQESMNATAQNDYTDLETKNLSPAEKDLLRQAGYDREAAQESLAQEKMFPQQKKEMRSNGVMADFTSKEETRKPEKKNLDTLDAEAEEVRLRKRINLKKK